MRDSEAHAAVRASVATAIGSMRVKAALAAHALEPEPALAAVLVDVLRGTAHWGDRLDAARGLAMFADDASADALRQCVVDDPEYLVRYHAAETLLRRTLGPTAMLTEHDTLFGLVVADDVASRRRALPLLAS